MATHPERDVRPHPLDQVLDEEVEAIFKADPDLKDRLRTSVEQIRRGEAKLIEHSEVRRRLIELGVPLDDEPGSPPSMPGV